MLSGLGDTCSQLLFALWRTGGGIKFTRETAETIRYFAVVKRKVLVFFSQSTQLKFGNLNT